MEWITAWLDGIPNTWIRACALGGGAALVMEVYQMVTGWRANRRLKRMDERQNKMERDQSETSEFLFQKFGKRIPIRGHFEAPAAEMIASGSFRNKKKHNFLFTFLRKAWAIMRVSPKKG